MSSLSSLTQKKDVSLPTLSSQILAELVHTFWEDIQVLSEVASEKTRDVRVIRSGSDKVFSFYVPVTLSRISKLKPYLR